jgi:hypothetical protein
MAGGRATATLAGAFSGPAAGVVWRATETTTTTMATMGPMSRCCRWLLAAPTASSHQHRCRRREAPHLPLRLTDWEEEEEWGGEAKSGVAVAVLMPVLVPVVLLQNLGQAAAAAAVVRRRRTRRGVWRTRRLCRRF